MVVLVAGGDNDRQAAASAARRAVADPPPLPPPAGATQARGCRCTASRHPARQSGFPAAAPHCATAVAHPKLLVATAGTRGQGAAQRTGGRTLPPPISAHTADNRKLRRVARLGACSLVAPHRLPRRHTLEWEEAYSGYGKIGNGIFSALGTDFVHVAHDAAVLVAVQ